MDKLSPHLEKLVVFEAACRHGTLQSAAKELRVTQPSVSRSIQTLEEALSVRLLHKGRRGVQPTTAGLKLLKYANKVLLGAKDVIQSLKSNSDDISGIVTIGTYESLAEYLWPDFIIEIQKQFPFLNLNLKTNSEKEHFRALEDATVDMVVDAEPMQRDGFVSWVLYKDYFSLFTIHHLLRRKIKTGNDHALPLIYVPTATDISGKSLRALINDQFENAFQQEIQLDSFSTVKRFVSKGVGVGALPLRLASLELEKQEIEPFIPSGVKHSLTFGEHRICATVLDKRSDDARLKAIVNLMRKFLKTKNMA
jgi:DNA-binding transcriptional LysR family regulator